MGAGFWIAVVLGVVVVFGILPVLVLSFIIYSVLLLRKGPDKWGRACTMPEDEEYFGMYKEGLAWGEKYAAAMRPVEVMSGKYHLVGEYFDFGGENAVLIIAGRTEACKYSYYFAEPYRAKGFNVLVIDNRAHGLSDGRVSCLGYREYADINAWVRFLTDKCGNRGVILHGICIGSSTALFAATAQDAPREILGIVAEGMYKNFYESYKNHIILQGRPDFPFTQGVMLWIRLVSHANVVTDGPFRRIERLKKPICFIHSRVDEFSDPKFAQMLYDKCTAPKRLVWFERGAHSRVRVNNPEQYDATVTEFIESVTAEDGAAIASV